MKLSIFSAILLIAGHQFVSAAPAATTTSKPTAATSTTKTYIAQFSPPLTVPAPTGIVSSYNYGPYNLSTALDTTGLTGFPTPWESPDPSHPEVQAVYKMIDWTKVPNAPVRKQTAAGAWEFSSDGPTDPYCWWSSSNCVTPKIDIPEDYYTCGRKGDWGLSYDDGPFNRYTGADAKTENPYAEPALYNFLAQNNNQKASLFYIGSNVATYPDAARRGFNDGHFISVHTWSHPPMTTVTNEQAVAELYWTLKAIKQVTGVTPVTWRPPQGDVDDRIRAIAWQMGLRTVIWDQDSEDWDMPAPGGGNLSPNTVNGYFKGWVATGEKGNDTTGHITLEHELNHATVNMSMTWLPTLQKVFNVIPALACNNVTQPYWEKQYVYPIENMTPATNTTNATAVVITTNPKWDASTFLTAGSNATAVNATTPVNGTTSMADATSTTIILSPTAA